MGCNNCEDSRGEKFNKICVVENIADQWSQLKILSIYKGYFPYS